MRTRRLARCAGLALVLAGCSSPVPPVEDAATSTSASVTPTPSPTFSVVPGSPMPTEVPAIGLVTTARPVTVIAHGNGAPEACLGGVRTSYPPQCGGPVLVGFDWADYPGHFVESHQVRFGGFVLTGRYDGTSLQVTSAVPLAQYDEPREAPVAPVAPDLSTRCPEPVGGWRVVDEQRTHERAVREVLVAARHLPGYAEAWVDRSRVPSDTGGSPSADLASDRTFWFTVNVQVTHDLAAATRSLRKVWGGALCVTEASYSRARLTAIQVRMARRPGVLASTAEPGTVEVRVVHDNGAVQAWADATYEPGMVTITSALVPVN